MVEMHNGCICCTLRGDLLKTVKELATGKQRYDYLVIESTGISEPLPVAQTFTMDVNGNEDEEEGHDNGEEMQDNDKDSGEEKKDDDAENNKAEETMQFDPLSKYARMDTLVTVLDAYNFASILGDVESESDRKKFFGDAPEEEESEESIVQLLIDQIEFANVILLNKIDLLGSENERDKKVQSIRALVKKLNPKATVLIPEKPKFDGFDVKEIVNTGLFDMEEAQESAGWLAELEKPYHVPETEEYGIGSFVFRNNERPFHPERLAKIMKNFGTSLVKDINKSNKKKVNKGNSNKNDGKDNLFSSVVRCKGELWMSNADCCPIDVHSVGRQLVMEPAGNGKPWMGKVVKVHPNGGEPESSEKFSDDDAEVWATFDLTNEAIGELVESGGWTDRFGDRRSELVLIGIKLDKKKLMEELNNALLTDQELNVAEKDRKKVWATDMEDSFFNGMPLWDLKDVLEVGDGTADDEEENK